MRSLLHIMIVITGAICFNHSNPVFKRHPNPFMNQRHPAPIHI